jgi:hypothetical protein
VPFKTTEYDRAFAEFVHRTANELARARSPLLAQIPVLPATGSASSVVGSRDGDELDLPEEAVGFEMSSSVDALRACDIDALTAAIDEGAEELGKALVGMFISTIDKVTEKMGNVVAAKGKSFDFETVIEALEKIEWTLYDNDELVLPQFVMHPDTAKNLPAEPTPEQAARLDELTQRKREELLARRRTRRLS